jgi:hypothetical protein
MSMERKSTERKSTERENMEMNMEMSTAMKK